MKDQFIQTIHTQMHGILSETQWNQLHEVLLSCLENVKLEPLDADDCTPQYTDYLKLCLAAKKIEGCSEKTIAYYEATISKMLQKLDKDICDVTTDDLRIYLTDYLEGNHISRVTIDNIRRIISGFFGWLEDENYI